MSLKRRIVALVGGSGAIGICVIDSRKIAAGAVHEVKSGELAKKLFEHAFLREGCRCNPPALHFYNDISHTQDQARRVRDVDISQPPGRPKLRTQNRCFERSNVPVVSL